MIDPNLVINGLGVAVEIAKTVPGLAEEAHKLEKVKEAAPVLQKSAAFFQSKSGRKAINQLEEFLDFFQSPEGIEAIRQARAALLAVEKMES